MNVLGIGHVYRVSIWALSLHIADASFLNTTRLNFGVLGQFVARNLQ